MGMGMGIWTYDSLQLSNEHALEDLTRLVRVSDILKGLSRVLAADVEEHFLSTSTQIVSPLHCRLSLSLHYRASHIASDQHLLLHWRGTQQTRV